MIFRQFLDDDLGCASYLVGDEKAGIAVAVDPPYEIAPLVAEGERRGVRIVRTLETHTHADHVSGHGRLALDHGVPVSIHSAAEAEYPNDPLADGDEVEVGDVRIRVLHTPGHRPEHCAFLVVDGSRGPEPWLVLTGDSLFVGDAARPDLAVAADEGAEGLFRSLHRLAELPDGVEVFPGHVAGSLCGAALSSKPSSTVGFERHFNRALQAREAAAFVAELTASLPPRPPNMEHIVELNRGPFVGAPQPLGLLDAAPGDGVVLDVRPVEAFAAGHVSGALNVPVDGGGFATKAGFLLPQGRPIVLRGSSNPELGRAAHGLRSVGFLTLAGYLVDLPETERLEPITIDEARRLHADGAIDLVDVREDDEWQRGAVPGSTHVAFSRIRDAELDGRPVVTICESGARAAVAASALAARGIEARPVVQGGIADWPA